MQDNRTVHPSAEELQEYRARFATMDTDKSNTLSLQEVTAFFHKEFETNVKFSKKNADSKIALDPDCKQAAMTEHDARVAMFSVFLDDQVKYFMQRDLNSDAMVSFDEFVMYEARKKQRKQNSV